MFPKQKDLVSQILQNLVFLSALIFSRGFLSSSAVILAISGYFLLCLLSFAVIYFSFCVLWYWKEKKSIFSSLASPYFWIFSGCLAIMIFIFIYIDLLFGILALFFVVTAVSHDIFVKDMVIVDVLGTGVEFSLKASLGAAMIKEQISPWLIICTFLLALLVALGQRRNEMNSSKETRVNSRQVLSQYTPRLLDQMIAVVTSSTILTYSLYTISTSPMKTIHSASLVYTIPFVIYGIMRFIYKVYTQDMTYSIELELLFDKPLIIDFTIWICIVFVIMCY